MGMIIPYILENEKCSKPPTRIIQWNMASGHCLKDAGRAPAMSPSIFSSHIFGHIPMVYG
jgi:hypothetical protein